MDLIDKVIIITESTDLIVLKCHKETKATNAAIANWKDSVDKCLSDTSDSVRDEITRLVEEYAQIKLRRPQGGAAELPYFCWAKRKLAMRGCNHAGG